MKESFLGRIVSKKIRLKRLKNKVIDYLSSIPKNEILDDQTQVLNFLKGNDISVFPYEFTKEYHSADIEILTSAEKNLLFAPWEGQKLFYKDGTHKSKAQKYFKSLLLEQDIRSPHRYLEGKFDVQQDDVIVDIGAAEGNFTLSVIDKVKHAYLFEPDENWVKALQATFEPWKNKVTIVQKLISEKTSNDSITLDDYFNKNESINFIKADVEGSEVSLLKGGAHIISRNKNLKIAICTYHNQEDAMTLDTMLSQFGFSNTFSKGYMLFHYGRNNEVKEPYLRKAILRAVKK